MFQEHRGKAKIMASCWIRPVSLEPRFFKGVCSKISCGEIFAKHGRHAAFQARSGEAKIMASCWIRALSLEPRSFKGVCAKISGGEIVAKHGRHAAFQARSGEAKIMASCWIRALSLEPRSFKGVCSKISCGEILARNGRHAAFQARGGEAKIMASCWIRALSLEPFQRRLFENFLRGNSCKPWAPRGVSSAKRGSKNHGKLLDSRRSRGIARENAKYPKKVVKKKSREFSLVLYLKNHPVGWCHFLYLLFRLHL